MKSEKKNPSRRAPLASPVFDDNRTARGLLMCTRWQVVGVACLGHIHRSMHNGDKEGNEKRAHLEA
jgi:hypothetical protein